MLSETYLLCSAILGDCGGLKLRSRSDFCETGLSGKYNPGLLGLEILGDSAAGVRGFLFDGEGGSMLMGKVMSGFGERR